MKEKYENIVTDFVFDKNDKGKLLRMGGRFRRLDENNNS